VNYLLITDKEYTIRDIRFLKEIIEDYKIISIDTFQLFSNRLLNKNLINYDFTNIEIIEKSKKHSKYFIDYILRLKKQIMFLNEIK